MLERIKQKWEWVVYFFFSLIINAYLIFQRGVWSFTDSQYYYSNLNKALGVFLSKFQSFSINGGYYFGFDNSLSFNNLMIDGFQLFLTFLFGSDFGQIIFYWSYYLIIFWFSLKLCKILFPLADENTIKVGALFLTFNPFSILLITMPSIGYVYAATFVFIYYFIQINSRFSWTSLFFLSLSSLYLLTYLRLIPIFILFIVAVLIYCFLFLRDKLRFNIMNLILAGIACFLVVLPVVFNVGYSFINKESVASNYAEGFKKFEEANYAFKKDPVNALSYPGGFTPSVISYHYNNRGLPGFVDNFADENSIEIYKIVHIVFNAMVVIVSLIFFARRNTKNSDFEGKYIYALLVLLFVFFVNCIGLFVNFDTFNQLHRTILLFLYNDYGFLQFIQVFFLAYLIMLSLQSFDKIKQKTIYATIVVSYLFVIITPYLIPHYALKKVPSIPEEYAKTFNNLNAGDPLQAAVFAPYDWLKFDWAPYFTNIWNITDSRYSSLIKPNLRIYSQEEISFYNKIFGSFYRENFTNLSVFNFKDLFLFKTLQTSNSNIDTYGLYDIAESSKKIQAQLKENPVLKIIEDNSHFTHYSFPKSDQYDFSLYSPKSVVDFDANNFYRYPLNIDKNPVMIDRTDINSLTTTNTENYTQNNVDIAFKSSSLTPTKYIVKLSRSDLNKPFLLQFNQLFSSSWGVYFADKTLWDNYKCVSDVKQYSITKNSQCKYDGKVIDYNDYQFLNNPQLSDNNHIHGNFLGNLFRFTPDDIPANLQNDKDIYLVIYFRKQHLYLAVMTISFATLILILSLMLWENIRQILTRKTLILK